MKLPQDKYKDEDCIRFCKDMDIAGLEVEHYQGRNFWQGPAVRVDHPSEVVNNTEVKCQWDNMGLGWIVYPRASDKGSK